MRRIPSPSDPNQDLRTGDPVSFSFDGAMVRGEIRRVDEKAHPDSPLGLPYLVAVIDAEPASGYFAGRDYTVRAACLVPESDIGDRPLRPARPVTMSGTKSAPAAPRFLVGYLREGGQFPVQGVIMVQASGLTEANGIATKALEAELATDIAEGREPEGTMVMLVNAAEVEAVPTNGILGQVSW
ncbi:MAG: hypothetical protein IBJ03_14820 [Gemmatimonadaceae bacterium]|nr:hypothetical protein [Gemmatimonadaceae bacterium]